MSELTSEDKKLHKALNEAMKENGGFFDTVLETVQAKRIEQLQTELDEYRWIPVSERLPESIADVFILTKEGSGGIGMYGEMDEGAYRWERLDHAINLNITHWMPIILPGQEEPEQGEFTKNIKASLERGDSKRTIIAYLKEVCRRYDWLVKRNAELQVGTLQTVADSNKLQLQAAEEIKHLRAENKKLVEGQQARKEAGS